MKITEAKSAYYKQYQKFSFAAADVAKQKEEAEKNARLHPDKAEEFNKQAATLEISLEALNKQKEEYMKHNEKIAEMECAYANMIVSQQQSEAMEESAAEELKILETARRIMKGDIVPPQDEEKLMKYNFKLYMAAKNMAVMAKEHEEDLLKEQLGAGQDPVPHGTLQRAGGAQRRGQRERRGLCALRQRLVAVFVAVQPKRRQPVAVFIQRRRPLPI